MPNPAVSTGEAAAPSAVPEGAPVRLEQSKFFDGIRSFIDIHGREYDPTLAYARIFPRTQDILAGFPLPPEEIDRLSAGVYREGHANLFYRAAEALISGIPVDAIGPGGYLGELSDLAREPSFRAGIEVASGESQIGRPNKPGGTVSLFDCELRSFHASIDGAMRGVLKDARVLAIYLPRKDLMAVEHDLADVRYDHVYRAFAYLRYYRTADAYIVAEIQSDVFSELRSKELKELYRHWPKVLMLAFEELTRFERASSGTEEHGPTRIHFVDPEYIKLRWPKIPDSRVNLLYSRLPTSLGFTQSTLPQPLKLEINPAGDRITLTNPWTLAIDEAASPHGLRGEFRTRLIPRDPQFCAELLALERHRILPIEYFDIPVEGYPVETSLAGWKTSWQGVPLRSFAGTESSTLTLVPQCRVALDTIPGIDRDFISYWQRLVAGAVAPDLLSALSPDVGFLHEPDELLERNWNFESSGAPTVIANPSAANTLMVNFHRAGEDAALTVGVRGGTGGFPMLSDSRAAFMNLLGLHALAERAGFTAGAPAVIPLEVALPTDIPEPSIRSSEPEWVSIVEFLARRDIGTQLEFSARPSMLRFYSRGAATLSDFVRHVELVLSRPDPEGLEDRRLMQTVRGILRSITADSPRSAGELLDERLFGFTGLLHGFGGYWNVVPAILRDANGAHVQDRITIAGEFIFPAASEITGLSRESQPPALPRYGHSPYKAMFTDLVTVMGASSFFTGICGEAGEIERVATIPSKATVETAGAARIDSDHLERLLQTDLSTRQREFYRHWREIGGRLQREGVVLP